MCLLRDFSGFNPKSFSANNSFDSFFQCTAFFSLFFEPYSGQPQPPDVSSGFGRFWQTHFGMNGLFSDFTCENLISAYKNRPHSVFLPDEKNPRSCFQKRFARTTLLTIKRIFNDQKKFYGFSGQAQQNNPIYCNFTTTLFSSYVLPQLLLPTFDFFHSVPRLPSENGGLPGRVNRKTQVESA